MYITRSPILDVYVNSSTLVLSPQVSGSSLLLASLQRVYSLALDSDQQTFLFSVDGCVSELLSLPFCKEIGPEKGSGREETALCAAHGCHLSAFWKKKMEPKPCHALPIVCVRLEPFGMLYEAGKSVMSILQSNCIHVIIICYIILDYIML